MGAPRLWICVPKRLASEEAHVLWRKALASNSSADFVAETAGSSLDAIHDDDDTLALAATAGCVAAFTSLVKRHQNRIYKMVHKYVEDPVLAFDVTQDTFITLHRDLDRYEARGRFRAYLSRIAINKVRMALRSRWLTRSLIPVPERHHSGTESKFDAAHDLSKAVLKLSPKLRAVIVLYYWRQMTHAEVAEVLQVPIGTVRRRLFDALRKMRLYLEDG